MKETPTIIIKKVRKGHHKRHGGSWKVAYADFVTAMMAFFLLLWLITMVSPEKRARIANYFKYFAVFQEAGTFMMKGSDSFISQSMGDAPKIPSEIGNQSTSVTRQSLADKLKKDVEQKLTDIKDQVLIDVFEGGVRIQLVDSNGQQMFELGKTALTDSASKILQVISDNIMPLPNNISIEGHTDSLTYASNKYTNWELSTERASVARRELEKNGMSPDRLMRVAGYAATDPLIKENPSDPRNRRISILLFFPEGDKSLEDLKKVNSHLGIKN